VEGSFEHGDEPSGSLKLLGISWMAAQLAASQKGLSSINKQISKYLQAKSTFHNSIEFFIGFHFS
jgi:hypothetical protein